MEKTVVIIVTQRHEEADHGEDVEGGPDQDPDLLVGEVAAGLALITLLEQRVQEDGVRWRMILLLISIVST